MKQIKVFATLLLLMIGMASSAQSLKEKKNYHKVFVEYSPMSVKSNISDMKYKFNGFGVGYNYTICMKDIPLHFGVGLKADYYFGKNTDDTDPQAPIEYSSQYISVLPAFNCGVDIHIANVVTLSPYFAVGMRVGLLGKQKATPAGGEEVKKGLFNKEEMDANNVWSRTTSSWEAGLNVFYSSFFLGFSYNSDFEKIAVNAKQIRAFGIKAGYVF